MDNQHVIILNGYPRSGKTLFTELLQSHARVVQHSSIDLVKDLCEDYFNWNGDKTPESRALLSNLKALLVAETDLVLDDIMKVYLDFKKSENDLLVVDIREPEEIEKYKNLLNNVTTVFIDRGDCQAILSNDSDAFVEEYDYDHYILNNESVENLEDEAKLLLRILDIE